MNPIESAKKLVKGCHKRLRVQDINTKCGGEVGDIGIIIKVYCKSCKSKISATFEANEEFLEKLKSFDKGLQFKVIHGKNKDRVIIMGDILEELGISELEQANKILKGAVGK